MGSSPIRGTAPNRELFDRINPAHPTKSVGHQAQTSNYKYHNPYDSAQIRSDVGRC